MFSSEFYNWKLITKDDIEVTIGTMLTSFSGVECELLSGYPPRADAPTGRVIVDRSFDNAIVTYPPSVFNVFWIKVYTDL